MAGDGEEERCRGGSRANVPRRRIMEGRGAPARYFERRGGGRLGRGTAVIGDGDGDEFGRVAARRVASHWADMGR